jgi:hypothetical protein
MTVFVTENNFRSYIQLNKINDRVLWASLAKNDVLHHREANIKKTINSGTMNGIIQKEHLSRWLTALQDMRILWQYTAYFKLYKYDKKNISFNWTWTFPFLVGGVPLKQPWWGGILPIFP